ncbi:MAG: YkgJ family cysteine cluster protein [Deltaproteobacteria bacterium]|nr:YkgJ family cysteine cluster protein [Deltaproteobacteria bacterium]
MVNSFTLTGLIRYIKLKLLGRDIIISGSCLQCGLCCRKLCLEIKGRWVTSENTFYKLVKANSDYERFKIIGRDEQGFLEFACTCLQEDGSCRDHDNRLKICRDFPEKDMFFMNGILPEGCGYSVQEWVSFEKILKKTIRKKGQK